MTKAKWFKGGRKTGLAIAVAALGSLSVMAHEFAPQSEDPSAGREVVRAYFKDLKHGQRIAHSRFETLESKYETGYLVVNASPAERAELEKLGYRIEADPQWLHRTAAMLAQEANVPLAEPTSIPNFSCYETVEESYAAAQALVAAKPTLATWNKIGESWQKKNNQGGYDLMVLKLTNSAISGNKPKLFINSAIHAREYATAPLSLAFAKQLINGYGTNADATWLLDHHEIHLLLQTNPDGRKKAETGILWRKNTNTAYCGATSNTRGADLNRNFRFEWNSTNGSGSSGSGCSEVYRGPSAGSEPETQAVQNYIYSLWPDRRGPNRNDPAPADTSGIHIDLHSHGRLLLWPYGTNGTVAPNDAQLATLGRKFAFFNNHTPQRSLDLYETDGTSDGPSYGELGVAAFTFELGTAFFESCSYYNNTILPTNLPALIYAAKVARTPYQTPAGPDAQSVAVSSGAVGAGTPVTLTAQLDDTRFNNTNGTEPTQTVAAGEYYVDTPPWVAGAVAKPMSAADGSFNSNKENVTASVSTTGWTPGKHLIYVRGRDSAGNWGAISAAFVEITDGGGGSAPTANFAAAINGLTASFTDQSSDDGTITARSWDFGDNTSSTQANPSHTYAAPGTYQVKLTVTDNEGKTGTVTKPVSLTADDAVVVVKGQPISNISDTVGGWKYFKLNVPAGATNLSVAISGGTGDADLYTRIGAKPDTSTYNCRPYRSGNSETCANAAPPAGWYYIGIRGYSAYSGVKLTVNYTGGAQ